MEYSLIRTFAGLTTAFAGIALGMSLIIVFLYWKVYCKTNNGKRLLPLHVMSIGISYSMLAVIAVARLGNPPPFIGTSFSEWWVYPFITLAFLVGDIALALILIFVHQRNTRYPRHNLERKTDGTGLCSDN